jgi:predicted regulator of Ras-like GTPase activity (Roadblock/LC7/MglB family)
MLLEFFSTPRDEMVTFESIDLINVMQIINLDKKTSALEIDFDGKKGIIYFKDGEIINGEYDNLTGGEAVSKLIDLNRGKISVKTIKRKVKRVVQVPFMKYMIETVKTIDEREFFRDKKPARVEVKKSKKDIINKKSIRKILQNLEAVKGYIGAGVFSPEGDLLEGVTVDGSKNNGIELKDAGFLVNVAIRNSQNVVDELGFGPLKTIQLYGETGIIFLVCQNDKKSHFYTALFITEDGNISIAKKKLQEVVESLKPELSSN